MDQRLKVGKLDHYRVVLVEDENGIPANPYGGTWQWGKARW